MPGKKQGKQEQPQILPVEWKVSDDIVARYATNMVVQRLENEFLISFFDIRPPIILGEPEDITKKLRETKSVTANCVAQIIVAVEKMPSFVNALENSIKRSIEVIDEPQVKK